MVPGSEVPAFVFEDDDEDDDEDDLNTLLMANHGGPAFGSGCKHRPYIGFALLR